MIDRNGVIALKFWQCMAVLLSTSFVCSPPVFGAEVKEPLLEQVRSSHVFSPMEESVCVSCGVGHGYFDKYLDVNLDECREEVALIPKSSVGRSVEPLAIQSYGFATGQTNEKTFFNFTSQYLQGDLVAQGEHCNIWVIRPNQVGYTGARAGSFTTFSELGTVYEWENIVYTDEKAWEIAKNIDITYRKLDSVARHQGILVEGAYTNIPEVGDIDLDGRVNLLLYDMGDDGGDITSGVKGTFTTSCFLTNYYESPIDLVHLDIGYLQGFDPETNQVYDNFYGNFAHEMQHLLFFMYLGCYLADVDEYKWINESMSGFADMYYGNPLVLTGQNPLEISEGRLYYGNLNGYSGGDGSYGDFIHFNGSSKNYGMSYLFSVYMNQQSSAYLSQMYRHFTTNLAESTHEKYQYLQTKTMQYYTMFDGIWGESLQKVERIGMMDVLSPALSYALTGSTEEKEVWTLYQGFMESYISNGGRNVQTGTNTVSLMDGNTFWNYKTAYPVLGDGGTVVLEGSNGTSSVGATHEMTYLLDTRGYDSNHALLSLSLPEGSLTHLSAYVALEKEGKADLYPVATGETVEVLVSPEERAYLFLSTYWEDVRMEVSMAWLSSGDVFEGEYPTFSEEEESEDQKYLDSEIFTVTFESNGGSTFVESYKTSRFGTLGSLPTANYGDMIFLGWFTEGGEQVTTDTVFRRDTTIYAQWMTEEHWLEAEAQNKTYYQGQIEHLSTQPIFSTLWKGSFVDSGFYYSTSSQAVLSQSSANLHLGAVDTGTDYLVQVYDFVELFGFSPQEGRTYYVQGYASLEDGSLLQTELLEFAIPTQGEVLHYESSFWDVSTSDWHEQYISYVAELGIMTGEQGYFDPNGSSQRGTIAQSLWNMYKATATSFQGRFSFLDVYGTGQETAVAWCLSETVMSGYESRIFGTEDSLTREQFAVTLLGFARATDLSMPSLGIPMEKFSDQSSVSWWAEEGVTWCVDVGLLAGFDGILNPLGTMTRAEMAAMLSTFAKSM